MEFNQLAMANAEGSDNMLNRVMPKDNIGLAALLRTKEAAWDNGECVNFIYMYSAFVRLKLYIYQNRYFNWHFNGREFSSSMREVGRGGGPPLIW